MAGKILDNGTLLALGLVGVVAAAGAASKAGLYGSRSTLSSYHEADLHDIVTRALDVDNVRIEDDSVDRHPDDGHSVVWSGTVYADGDALSRRVNP